MAKQKIKFEKPWDDDGYDDWTIGKPFRIYREGRKYEIKEHARFVFDELLQILIIQDDKGKILMYFEEDEEMKTFFKRALEMRKALKDHPLDILI